jgi:hypothetical protein
MKAGDIGFFVAVAALLILGNLQVWYMNKGIKEPNYRKSQKPMKACSGA